MLCLLAMWYEWHDIDNMKTVATAGCGKTNSIRSIMLQMCRIKLVLTVAYKT